MNNEEKKAISELIHFDCAYNDEIKIVLNLIEKQHKEIEFYRNNNCILENQNGEVVAIKYCPENYISKNKIREKIEEYRKQVKEYEKQEESFPFSGFWHNELLKATHKINVLQELLEEGITNE